MPQPNSSALTATLTAFASSEGRLTFLVRRDPQTDHTDLVLLMQAARESGGLTREAFLEQVSEQSGCILEELTEWARSGSTSLCGAGRLNVLNKAYELLGTLTRVKGSDTHHHVYSRKQ